MKPSKVTALQLKSLEDFLEAYGWLLRNSRAHVDEEHYSWWQQPTVSAGEWAEGRARVGVAAGGAAAALARFGGSYDLDPVAKWSTSLIASHEVGPAEVQACIRAAVGSARRQLEIEQQRERGLTGAVASFIRWPQSVREAVGGSQGQQRAASVLGLGLQVVAGLVVAGILWLVSSGAARLLG